jgi:hypothetical protein
MNRNKINRRLTILAVTGILILSFVPFAVANEGRVTERPIEDWLNAQWDFIYMITGYDVQNWGIGDYVSPDSLLVAKMGYPFPFPWMPNFLDENGLVVGETTFGGCVIERELNDGTALITVHLDVWNAPLTVFFFPEFANYVLGGGARPSAILGSYEDGYIDYQLIFKFYVEAPGQPLPFFGFAYNNYISIHIVGTGYGTLTDHAADFGYTPGATGMLKLHQIALFKPDFGDDHPNYDPVYHDLWPVETIEIHEL